MKRLMKRWLAMVLVVLMVMGTLPTTAWAARIEDDAVPATPVVDGKDGVVDTLAKSGKDDDVIPIDPVDPDPEPVDPTWESRELTVTINEDGSWSAVVTTDMTSDTGSGVWAFALIPDYLVAGGSNRKTPTTMWMGNEINDSSANGAVTLRSTLAGGTGQTHGFDTGTFIVVGSGVGFNSSGLKFTINSDDGSKLPEPNVLCERLGLPEGTPVKYCAFFYAQSSTKKVVSFNDVYQRGTYLNNATYVLDIFDNSVTLDTEVAGSYDGYGALSLDIANTSTGAVYSSAGQMTIVQKIGAGDALTDPAAMTYTFDAGGTTGLPISLSNPSGLKAGDTMTISVPYFDKDLSGADAASAQKLGTATITVIVVDQGSVGEPITFTVIENDPTPQTAYITVLGDISGIYDEGGDDEETGSWLYADGTEFKFGDDTYGLTWALDESQTDPSGDYPLIYGSCSGGVGKCEVVITPPATLKASDSPYFTNFEILGAWNAEDTMFDVLIPITIIVLPDEGPPALTYKLTYEDPWEVNGVTVPDPVDNLPDATYTPLSNPTGTPDTGWSFKGWSTDGTAANIVDGVNPKDNDTVYAVWEVTLTWDENYTGGSASTTTVTLGSTAGTAVNGTVGTVQATPSGRSGYSCDGWFTGATNGNAVTATTAVSGPATYYAHWTQNTHKVTYTAGTLAGDATIATYIPGQSYEPEGEAYTVEGLASTPPTPILDAGGMGWTFTGWSDGTNTYAPGASYPMGTDDVTFTAQWEKVEHTVTYHKGAVPAATIGTATYTVQHGDTHPVKTTSDMTGISGKWYFKEWNKSGTLTVTGDVDITALWKVDVEFDTQEIGYSATTQTVDHGAQASSPTVTPNRPGYTIEGWYTEAACTNKWNFSDAVNEPMTLYAKWEAGKFTLTWNPMGGTWGDASGTASKTESVTVGTIISPPTTPPTRAGYKFEGWVEEDGTPVTFTASSPTMPAEAKTYYAKWTPNKITVNVYLATVLAPTDAPSDTPGPVKLVSGGTTLSETGTHSTGVYNFEQLVDGTAYDVMIGGTKVGTFTAGEGDNDPLDYKYYEVQVVTSDATMGTAKMTIGGDENEHENSDPDTPTSVIVLENTEVIWTASPKTYYDFTGWTGTPTASGNPYTVAKVTAPKKYVAGFQQKTCTVTVNIMNRPISGPDTEHKFSGDVKLGSAGTYKTNITSAATATITGVPQSDTSYEIYLGNDRTSVSVTPNDNEVEKTVYFYELKVTAGANGSADLAGTSVATGTSESKYYLPGTTGITINATGNTDWGFLNWTGDTGNVTGLATGTASNTITTDDKGKTASLTANFKKIAYSATIKVFLNDVQQADTDMGTGKPITATPTIAKTIGSTTEVPVMTYDSSTKVWNVSNLRDDNTYTVTVPSITGDYTWTIAEEGENVEAKFYGVTVEDGQYGNASKKPYLKDSGTQRAVMPVGKKVTINANPDSDYVFSKWLAGDASNPTDDLDATARKVTAPGSGDFSFNDGYAAGNDLYLKPVYTFNATVQTKYGTGNQAPGGDVVLKASGGTGTTVTLANFDGEEDLTKLIPGTTYTVWVNGFETATQITGPGIRAITLYKVKVAKDPTDSTGTVYINLGTSGSTGKTEIYIPEGGKSAGADAAAGIHLQADGKDASDTATGYRLKNLTGETLWTVETIPADKNMTLTVANATNTTPTTATVGGANGMSQDVTITASFQKQYTAHATVAGSGSVAVDATDKGGVGTTVTSPNAVVDDGGYIKVTYSKVTGYTLDNWTFPSGSEVWTTSNKAAGTQLTSGTATTETTVYFFPAATNAVITAHAKAATYPVTVTVNLDNAAYKDTDASKKVQVKIKGTTAGGATQEYDLSKSADGVYAHTAVLPGTYKIYINGTDLSKTVAATTDFDTGKTLEFAAADAEKDPPEETSATVNYYTVNLAVDTTTTNAGTGYVNFGTSGSGTETTASKIYLAGSGEDIKIYANPENSATVHNRFDKWEITAPTTKPGSFANTPTKTGETYKFPDEDTLIHKTDGNFDITPTNQITLTATFVKRYTVTVAKGDNSSSVTPQVHTVSDPTSSGWTGSVTVDAGTTVYLKVLGTAASTVAFKDWTEEGTATNGFDNTGHGTAASAKDKGYLELAAFTPTRDTTIKLNYWQKANLLGGWRYDRSNPSGHATVPGNDPPVKELKWTPNDTLVVSGKQEPTGIEVQKKSGSTFATEPTFDGTQLTLKSGSTTYYEFDENYLKGLTDGEYKVIFTYTLGSPSDHPNKNTSATVEATFHIKTTTYALTEVNVVTKDNKTSSSASPDDAARDAVIYSSHKATQIPEDNLVFEWYYADTAPIQKAYKDTKDASGSVTQTAGDGARAALTTLVGLRAISTGVTPWPDATTDTISTGVVKVTDDMKGKYIFAVVTLDEDSTYGEGAVITNAIPVDCEAEITVNENETQVTETTQAAAEARYTVWVVPKSSAVDLTNPGAAAGANQAAYDTTSKTYKTTGSAISAYGEYYVYVQEVEGKKTQYIRLQTEATPSTDVVINFNNRTATANYYSVTLTPLGSKGLTATDHPYLEHAKDNSTPQKEVGETWDKDSMPVVEAETSVNKVKVTNAAGNNAVLRGTAVKATAADKYPADTTKNVGWDQDYRLNWYTDEATANTLVAKGSVQTSATAVSNGYTTGAITHATEITGKLLQNTYRIQGNVANPSGKTGGKIIASGTDVPTLTFQVKDGDGAVTATYKFNGAVTGGTGGAGGTAGGPGATVTFTVPRSGLTAGTGTITGTYFLEATPSKNPATTLVSYAVPVATAVPSSPQQDVSVIAGGANNDLREGQFTIFIEASEAKITVHDDTPPKNNTATASNGAPANTGNGNQWQKVFANYSEAGGDKMTYDVTIENDGNAPLNVELELIQIKGSTQTTLYKKGTNILTGTGKDTDSTNDVQFTDLADEFPLAVGAAETFTVTIPKNLDNDDDVTYRFKFTTSDSRDGFNTICPTGQYDLKLVIDPVEVATVDTKYDEDTNTYTVNATTIKQNMGYGELITKEDATWNNTDGDITYKWYIAEWNADIRMDPAVGVPYRNNPSKTPLVPLDENAGVSLDGLSYTPKPVDLGKALYLVATGQKNASLSAMTPDRTGEEPKPPVLVPFIGTIYVDEGQSNHITDNKTIDPGKDDYVIYLWEKHNGDFDLDPTNPKLIQASWDGTAFVTEKVLYATNPEDPATNDPYEYYVYANTVKGDDTLQNTNQKITVGTKTATVQYWQVNIDDTKVHQNDYQNADGTNRLGVTADTDLFYAGPTRGKPTAEVESINVTVSPAGWVQTGTDVTFTYLEWDKDYDLNWKGATGTLADKPKTGDRSQKATYSSQLDPVETELKLNLYEVTAEVTGSVGSVGFIDMTLYEGKGDNQKTYAFTSKDGVTNKIFGATANWNTPITVGSTVKFRLPKADGDDYVYVVSGNNDRDPAADFEGYTYGSNVYDYVEADPDNSIEEQNNTFNFNTVGDTSLDKYEVRLKGEGLSMRVKGDVANTTNGLGKKNLVSPATTSVGGQATILPSGTDRTPAGTNATDTVYLNFNYGQDLKVVVKASNESRQGAKEDECVLRKVTFAEGANDPDKFTVDTNPFNAPGKDLTRSGNAEDGWEPESGEVSLTIKSGLPVGKHTFTGTFTFQNSDGTPLSNTITYTLDVYVQPLTFTEVLITDETDAGGAKTGKLTIQDYSVKRKAEAGTAVEDLGAFPPSATETDPDTRTDGSSGTTISNGLTKAGDYSYQWIRTPASVTTPNIMWDSADGQLKALGGAAANYEIINSANAKTYDPNNATDKADNQGKNIYLVIYPQSTTGNVTHYAVSTAQVNTYQGIVYVNVDGGRKGETNNAPDPGYAVVFTGEDGSTVPGAWQQVSGTTNYAYVGALVPGQDYTVSVSRTNTGVETTDVMVDQTAKKLNGTDIGTGTSNSNVIEVDYYTVSAVKFSTEPYQDGTGETFPVDIIPEIYLGTTDVTGKTVLDGQSVTAKVPETTTGSGKGWTQDYTLTWRSKNDDNNAVVSATTDDNLSDISPAIEQDAATAVATGLSGTNSVSITAKTFIGGRLDQNTYKVTGKIVGTSVYAEALTVTMTGGTGNKIYGLTSPAGPGTPDITDNNTWSTGNSDSMLNNGDTVTFTVVKGKYDITAYEKTGSTVTKVTVGGEGDPVLTTELDTVSTRNKETLGGDEDSGNTDVEQDGRIFTVYLEPTGEKLGVKDDQTGATYTVSSPKESKDHQHADNEKAYFFHGIETPDHDFELKLNNPGNVDLTLKDAPEVWWLPSGTDYTSIETALTSGRKLTVGTGGALSDGTNTYAVTVTGLPAPTAQSPVIVPIGAGETGSGVDAQDGGVVAVNTDAVNTDDGIYIIKYTSVFTEEDGTPNGAEKTGPTVYYVFDLTVNPLPIKEVTMERDPDKDDGTLRLKNNALNSVLVDDDGDSTNSNVAADTVNLTDTATGDIKYAWVKVPVDEAALAADDLTLTNGALTVSANGLAKNAELITNNSGALVGTKSYKPEAAEQGMNFYLIAYSAGDAKNASEFAVSDAHYAEVTISLETRRTGDSSVIDSKKVQIKSTVGETEYTSNTAKDGKDPIIVTAATDPDLTFTADLNVYMKANPTATDDDPAQAEYYFIDWKVKDVEDNVGTTGVTPADGDRLTMNYNVSGQATVIGYYDLLPNLTGAPVYKKEGDKVPPESAHTFHYEDNDGSGEGKVVAIIEPKPGTTTTFKVEGLTKIRLDGTSTYFAKVAGTEVGDTDNLPLGDAGDYVLAEEFIRTYLSDEESDYIITFYDTVKGEFSDPVAGTTNDKGYPGYDRTIDYTISTGEKLVKAQVKNEGTDTDPKYYGQVQITDGADVDGNPAETDSGTSVELYTKDTKVTLHAIPKAGYVFTGWKEILEEGAKKGTFSPNANDKEPVFLPKEQVATVEASFAPADFEVKSGAASVYFGNNKLEDTPDTLTVTGTKDANQIVTVSLPKYSGNDEAEAEAAKLKAYLKEEEGKSDAEADAIVAKAAATPNWLGFDTASSTTTDGAPVTTATFKVNDGATATGVNVQKKKDASGNVLKDENGKPIDADEAEIVAYVKIVTNAGQVKYVPYTVDVMTSKLTIVTPKTPDSTEQTEIQMTDEGAAYKTLFEAGEGAIPDHDDKVYLEYFAYTAVQNYYNEDDKLDVDDHPAHAAGENRWDKTAGVSNDGYGVVTNGKWTVKETTFDGTGDNEYIAPGTDGYPATNSHNYVFTFHYTGADTAEDDYNYEDTTITLTIPAKVPEMSLKFSDTLKTDTDDGTKYLLTKGTHSDAKEEDGTTAGGAPITLAQAVNADRTDEHITYLDEEPVFYVTLHKVGSLAKVELIPTGVDGFEVDPDKLKFTIDNTQTTQTLEFPVKLSKLENGLWADTHTITITAKGYPDANKPDNFIKASYQLEIKMDPRVITSLNVTVKDGEQPKPEDVEPTIEGNPHMNEDGKDDKGNTPIKKATATWGPQTGEKNTQVKVDVEIDPNYKYAEEKDETPEEEDITKNTGLTVKTEEDKTHPTPKPTVKRDDDDGDHIVHITQPIPYLMHSDGKVGDDETGEPMVKYVHKVTVQQGGKVDNYTVNLGAYGNKVFDVLWTRTQEPDDKPLVGEEDGIGVTLKDSEGNDLTWWTDPFTELDDATDGGEKPSFILDFSAADTSKPGTYTFRLQAAGKADPEDVERGLISTYVFTLVISNPPSPGGPVEPPCPCKVLYHIGTHGTTADPTIEDVAEKSRPGKVPTVTPVDGYVFRGWSLTNPATLKKGEQPVLVDPKTVDAKGETMIFYAVLQERPFHEHYVIGYPSGNFGPADDINRASVATIIARAILPDFVEGANYGNPGNYSDVSGHWAESAIAYCSKFGVFVGMPDGTFQPDRPITRQEFALVIARLDGVMKAGELNVSDIDDIAVWALDGVYTAYAKGWVNGYPDGTFKPMNNIRRDEAVKVFNAYLGRGVDANGLRGLHEYVYPSQNNGNDFDEYRTWPDVPSNHWAYYEIIEAANDHEYEAEMDGTYKVPETWNKCWIDARWGLSTAGGSAAMVSAGFQVWFH